MSSNIASHHPRCENVPIFLRVARGCAVISFVTHMSPGFSIAHYRVTSKIGEGGMGEVWRATDTKLNREVAIKVIPESFAIDPDRMARFTREAQVLASLN